MPGIPYFLLPEFLPELQRFLEGGGGHNAPCPRLIYAYIHVISYRYDK